MGCNACNVVQHGATRNVALRCNMLYWVSGVGYIDRLRSECALNATSRLVRLQRRRALRQLLQLPTTDVCADQPTALHAAKAAVTIGRGVSRRRTPLPLLLSRVVSRAGLGRTLPAPNAVRQALVHGGRQAYLGQLCVDLLRPGKVVRAHILRGCGANRLARCCFRLQLGTGLATGSVGAQLGESRFRKLVEN